MAMPLTALIIDDEPLARQELQYLLDAAGDVSVLAQGTNGIEAVELIRTHKPDVIFLDVRMPGLDGFAVLKKVLAQDRKMKLPQVVFATAFDQYAVKAFEVNAVDYLLKPFDSKRVQRTLEKVRERVTSATELAAESLGGVTGSVNGSGGGGEGRVASRVAGAEAKLDALLRMVEERTGMRAGLPTGIAPAGAVPAGSVGLGRSGKVVVRAQSRLLLVDQKDLCFATIEEGRISVVTKALEGDSNCRTLEELTDQLDPEQFWRVHRSFVVNIQHIREVVPWFKSSYQLRMDDRKQTEVPVSRSQTKRLRELFNL
jgi:two-component system LytT family response regulator/two-component system response regulator LytT